ncbi:MAG: hypothetical protein IJ716_12130 [Lachnospiraceae bacterium]|nr:hypothetical protein [Lachnospiraceae bacterium]
MKNFGTLFWYEMKKICGNRTTQAVFLVLVFFSVMQGLMQVDMDKDDWRFTEYRKIDGRSLDDALLSEMVEAADEYGVRWEASNIAYMPLSEFVREVGEYGTPLAEYNAEKIYEKRMDRIEEAKQMCQLTEPEIAFWAQKEGLVGKPFVWRMQIVPQAMVDGVANNMVAFLFLITISLSGVFAQETHLRTLPMLQVAQNGWRSLYWAKIAAGMCFVTGSFMVVLGLFFVVCVSKWGTEGLDAAVQLLYPFSESPIEIGELVVILLVLVFSASLMLAGMTMLLSEVLRNAVAVMAVMLGGYVGTIALAHQIPYSQRLLSQMNDLSPAILVTPRVVYEYRLIRIAGHYLTAYQAAPMLYMGIAVALVLLGGRWYRRR